MIVYMHLGPSSPAQPHEIEQGEPTDQMHVDTRSACATNHRCDFSAKHVAGYEAYNLIFRGCHDSQSLYLDICVVDAGSLNSVL